ncbi:hypothetical protein TNCV_3649121 [Trichonephila clavipes]|nr:hypothetical protein TNCV_3649121 [Trichonephila clavipes]
MEQSNKNITNADTLTSERERNLAKENGDTQQANINNENMQDYNDQQPSEKGIVQLEDISNARPKGVRKCRRGTEEVIGSPHCGNVMDALELLAEFDQLIRS